MPIVGERVILREERRDTDAEDLFRWMNLKEWQYYDEPDKPFKSVSREEFDEWRHRPRKRALGSRRWE